MASAVACLGRGLKGYESEQDVYARVKKAVEIFKTKNPDYLILSGGYTTSKEFSEASFMKRIACDMGVDESRILLDEKSMNTVENAVNVNEIANEHGIDTITVVTSPYHLMRTKIIFTRLVKGKKLFFFASNYPFHPTALLLHYFSEVSRLLRILIFGIKPPKRK